MTLENLKEALYLNNVILLNKIKALKDSIDDIISVDIETLKNLIDNINDNDISNINNKIDNINNTEIPNLKQSINDINNTKLVNLKQLIDDLTNDLSNHTSDTIIHVTQNDKDLWNAALQNAKDYAKKLFDSVTSFSIEIVESLPTKDIKSMTIYFIRNGRDNETDYYEEYMYINNKWEIIGSTFVNLTPYLLKEDFEKYQQEITDKFTKYNTSDEIANTLKDYLLIQTFNDTIKNYTTTEALQKLLEEYAKIENIHTHENKDIIDKLSESADGNLLFNGQEIKGGSGSDITISEENNNAIQQKDDGIFVEDKTEQIDNIQTQVNRVSIAQKTINGVTDYYFIGGMNPANTNNTNNINITSNTSIIYSLKQVLSYEDNTGLKISDDGYVTLTEGSWDLTCGTLNAGNNYINFSWRDRNGNIYGNMGFVPGGSHSVYDLDSNAIITVSPGEILEIAPISQLDITVQSFFTFIKIIKISTREIDPVEYINTTQGIEDAPIGHIISYMGNNAPKHYLICDGTEYNITDYPHLAQHFMDEFGSYNYFGGDGITTFAVPDLRGEFLRGTGTAARDTGSGADAGIHQEPTHHLLINKDSNNKIYFDSGANIGILGARNYDSEYIINSTGVTLHNKSTNWKSNGITYYTSRPTNTSVLYCIKYEPTYYMTVGEYTVQGFEDYSEEEKVIGKWINGKPIYRKVFRFTSPSVSTTDIFISKIQDIDYLISSYGTIIRLLKSGKLSLMSFPHSNHNGSIYSYIYNNDELWVGVYVSNSSALNGILSRPGIIIVEYTKTTDKENSFTPDMLSTIVMSGNKQEDLTEEELNNLIADTINLLNE